MRQACAAVGLSTAEPSECDNVGQEALAVGRLAMVVSFLLLSVLSVGAQDLLFEGTRQVGAIGHFGRDLGPAPALVHNRLTGGGRFVIDGDVAVDWQAGTSVPLGPGFVVGFDRARPRVFEGPAG